MGVIGVDGFGLFGRFYRVLWQTNLKAHQLSFSLKAELGSLTKKTVIQRHGFGRTVWCILRSASKPQWQERGVLALKIFSEIIDPC